MKATGRSCHWKSTRLGINDLENIQVLVLHLKEKLCRILNTYTTKHFLKEAVSIMLPRQLKSFRMFIQHICAAALVLGLASPLAWAQGQQQGQSGTQNSSTQQQNQQRQNQQQPKMNQKEAEQKLKLLQQKEKNIQERLKSQSCQKGSMQGKDW